MNGKTLQDMIPSNSLVCHNEGAAPMNEGATREQPSLDEIVQGVNDIEEEDISPECEDWLDDMCGSLDEPELPPDAPAYWLVSDFRSAADIPNMDDNTPAETSQNGNTTAPLNKEPAHTPDEIRQSHVEISPVCAKDTQIENACHVNNKNNINNNNNDAVKNNTTSSQEKDINASLIGYWKLDTSRLDAWLSCCGTPQITVMSPLPPASPVKMGDQVYVTWVSDPHNIKVCVRNPDILSRQKKDNVHMRH